MEKKILVIGSGISGLTAAIMTAESGNKAVLVSPYPSERSQSVMAAGGINAVLGDSDDAVELHINDTLSGGKNIAGFETVSRLCNDAPKIIRFLEKLGVVFSRDDKGEVARRAFGGQSKKRTVYAGASTGKQIVSGLVQKCREYECSGAVERVFGLKFHSALIKDNTCFGALFYKEGFEEFVPIYADAVIFATGGQNALFGKTTGSTLCDGYAAAKLFMQGAMLKNPEFIQYHPTTIETAQKRMLITEGARGEGGRLYYLDKNNNRVYFMEEMFGEKGNLMPRDIVSKCIYDAPGKVYLDITFLGEKAIKKKLAEVYDLCLTYLDLDVTKESIPVYPSVHFFMGGLAVDKNHRTNIKRMYAVGECASIYHGANRLGGNSLLAAIHSSRVAVKDALDLETDTSQKPDFSDYAQDVKKSFEKEGENSPFSAVYMIKNIESVMQNEMGISRNGEKLKYNVPIRVDTFES